MKDLSVILTSICRPVNDNRASLLRSSTTVRKPVNERDIYMHAWKNYVTFAFRVVPPIPSPVIRCASPDLSLRYAYVTEAIYISCAGWYFGYKKTIKRYIYIYLSYYYYYYSYNKSLAAFFVEQK